MSNYDSLVYLHCTDCIDEVQEHGVPMKEYARLQVGVSPKGDLLLECLRHESIVASLSNDVVASALKTVGKTECDCGRVHSKETVH